MGAQRTKANIGERALALFLIDMSVTWQWNCTGDTAGWHGGDSGHFNISKQVRCDRAIDWSTGANAAIVHYTAMLGSSNNQDKWAKFWSFVWLLVINHTIHTLAVNVPAMPPRAPFWPSMPQPLIIICAQRCKESAREPSRTGTQWAPLEQLKFP